MPYLQLAPRPGNTAGGLLATAAHWLCPGLRIATWVRPPRLTRGAAGVSLSPAPRSRQSSPPGLFMGQMGSLLAVAARYADQWHSWFRIAGHVMAHLPVLLTGGRNVPAVLGMQLSRWYLPEIPAKWRQNSEGCFPQ